MGNIILNLLFPKRCVGCRKFGSFICPECFSKISFTNDFSCPVCLRPAVDGFTHPKCKKENGLDGVIPIIIYRGIIKKLLYQFKYSPYLTSLAPVLSRLIYEGLIQNESFCTGFGSNCIVIPVPLSKKRERERGYNHAALLATDLAKRLSFVFVPDVLTRTKDTAPQYKLSKEKRIKNVKDAFETSKKRKMLQGKTVLLIDDITTTYATLKECAKVLKKAGAASVIGITLAKEA